MPKLKAFDFYFSLHGFEFGFPLCCVDWFESVWLTSLRADEDLNPWPRGEKPFTGYNTSRLSDQRILCPTCVIRELKKKIQ